MIAKFARYRGMGGGRQVSPAPAAHSNDNHLLRHVFSDPQRTPRRVLVCHWRVRPQTGALECVWGTQAVKCPADTVIDEDPKICWSGGCARWARDRFIVCTAGRAAAA